jgi:hypothetical protein
MHSPKWTQLDSGADMITNSLLAVEKSALSRKPQVAKTMHSCQWFADGMTDKVKVTIIAGQPEEGIGTNSGRNNRQ